MSSTRSPNEKRTRPHLWSQRTTPLTWSSDIGVTYVVLLVSAVLGFAIFGPLGVLVGAGVGLIAGPMLERELRGDRSGSVALVACAVCGADTISPSGRCPDHRAG